MRAQSLFAILLLLCVWATAAWADVFCPKCGQQFQDTYNYCPKDGTDLNAVRKAAAEAATRPEPVEPSRTVPEPPARPAAPAIAATDWTADLPIHLPEVYPDANLGDFSIYAWSQAGTSEGAIFFRTVIRRGEQGRITVLSTTLPWPRKSKNDVPPSLRTVLDRIDTSNTRREDWSDYRDFARSFVLQGQQHLSPFVGGEKAARLYQKDYSINQGKVGCDVAEYRLKRNGKASVHTIRTSRLVPFAFVESTYDTPAEKLRLYLFGTIDEDELAPLERLFPASGD